MRRLVVMFLAAVSMAATAYAQAPATTFVELPSRLSIGETVFATNRAGETVKGTVRQVSGTVLVLRQGPNDLTLNASDVQRITRRGHTLRNGALIGLVAGFITGAAVAASLGCGNYFCPGRPAGVFGIGGIFGSIGTGVGAAVGASIRREQVVFEQAAITSSVRRGTAGLSVTMAW